MTSRNTPKGRPTVSTVEIVVTIHLHRVSQSPKGSTDGYKTGRLGCGLGCRLGVAIPEGRPMVSMLIAMARSEAVRSQSPKDDRRGFPLI